MGGREVEGAGLGSAFFTHIHRLVALDRLLAGAAERHHPAMTSLKKRKQFNEISLRTSPNHPMSDSSVTMVLIISRGSLTRHPSTHEIHKIF